VSLTVDNALGILELLGDGELRLIDFSSKLGEHRSTAQRLLTTLQARGFVRQDGDSACYSLELNIPQLASATLGTIDLREAARAHAASRRPYQRDDPPHRV
jgi:DNA-binding IclR family transcriptional regulator